MTTAARNARRTRGNGSPSGRQFTSRTLTAECQTALRIANRCRLGPHSRRSPRSDHR